MTINVDFAIMKFFHRKYKKLPLANASLKQTKIINMTFIRLLIEKIINKKKLI
jgi:hypothetical protein